MRARSLNRAIDQARNVIEEYRTKAEGLQSPQFREGSGGHRKHDAFENRVIEYVEKTQDAQIALLDLSFEQMELEGKLMEISGDTDDYEIADLIGRYFESYM